MPRSASPRSRRHPVPAPKFVSPLGATMDLRPGLSITDGFKVGLGAELASRAVQSVLGSKEKTPVDSQKITEFQECMQKNQQNYSVCKDLLPK